MRTYRQGGFTRVKTGLFDKVIPKNTPEIGGWVDFGGMVMGKMGRKGIKTGVCGGIGVC